MKKIFLLFLLSLLMTGSAFAECLMYIDDFTVTPDQLGTEIELRIKAEFSARVSAWQLDLTYPEGLTPVEAVLGADGDITYLNSRGRTMIHTPPFNATADFSRLIAMSSQTGYWYDPDTGELTSYGEVKWEGGTYEEMVILYVEVSEDFQGGEIIMNTMCASTVDPRGGTVRENGDNAVTFTHVCNVGVSGSSPEAYACYTPSNTTLTFYYDALRSTRVGTTYDLNTGHSSPLWYGDGTCSSVTQVVFDPSFANARPTTTYAWFAKMSNLTSITNINYLNTINVTDMGHMFYQCYNLTSIDVSGFNTSQVTNMRCMFYNCNKFTSLNVSNFNTANVTDMNNMFYKCYGLTSLNLSSFNTANVTDMSYMFYYCYGLQSLNVSSFNTKNVTNMSCMFQNCYRLTSLYVRNFNTANVTNMGSMFYNCSDLTSLDVSNFNTANVTDMRSMFYGCSDLTSLDLSSFNTTNVTNMGSMFDNCTDLTSLDLSSFNTANVSNMGYMFYYCYSLTSLDLSNFNTTNVTNMTYMFNNCSDLTTIYAGNSWSTAAVTSSPNMFRGCTSLVGGMGTNYDENHVDVAYAHIDGGPSNPGYFTSKVTPGDVNGDGEVAIADVTALIHYLLTGDTTGVDVNGADCNQDGEVGIADVTALIHYLLTGNW